jgi:hypothetical protein
MRLGTDDMLILYRTEFREAMDSSGNGLGHKGLIELVRGLATESLAQVSRALMSGRQAFSQRRPPRGAETQMVLRRAME